MSFLANLLKLVGVLVPCSVLLVCTRDMDGTASGSRSGRSSPPLGAAKGSLTESGWKVVASGDFNFDGMVDVLWHDPGHDALSVWLMHGTQLHTPGPLFPGPSGDGWRPLTPADFNADGMADVAWSNSEQGTMAAWLMTGTEILVPGPVIPGPSGAGWNAVTASDFNLDGSADMLWYNATKHRMAVWLMAGTKLLLPGPELPTPDGDGWQVVTATDTDFDNMADVVWSNPQTNQFSIWRMRGTQLVTPGPVIPGPSGAGWVVVTATDLNFDGMSDMLWNNPETNELAVWLMNGTSLLLPGPAIPGPSGAGWIAEHAADFNFDGMSDVIWGNPDPSRITVWLMNGTSLLLPGPEIPAPAAIGP